jgi:hypothetical protein
MPSGVENLSFDVEELSSLAVTENANVWNDDNNSMCITNSLIIFMVNPHGSFNEFIKRILRKKRKFC